MLEHRTMTARPAPGLEPGTRDPQTLIRLLQTELATTRLLQAELATTNHEVMTLTLDLEKRVAERVTQLSTANKDLERENVERRRADEEVRRLNQDLERRAELLEAANSELETFSYSVSHDLRAPLRHILGFAAMLRDDAGKELGEKPRQHLDKITQSATRMSSLIDDLLYFSRFSHVELTRESVDLNAIVDGVIRDQETEVKGRNIVWKRTPLPRVWGDLALLRQVMVNLVSNALKYSRKSDPAEIEIGVQESRPRETVFFIRDNGVGFDARYSNKLFGVFQRLHKATDFEGTGIGLASVRRIIARHGGKTWAEGKVGKGATFYFSLTTGTTSPCSPIRKS
jgi:light-regulated signal transduction histidine kinase (bacteriophytochrome)